MSAGAQHDSRKVRGHEECAVETKDGVHDVIQQSCGELGWDAYKSAVQYRHYYHHLWQQYQQQQQQQQFWMQLGLHEKSMRCCNGPSSSSLEGENRKLSFQNLQRQPLHVLHQRERCIDVMLIRMDCGRGLECRVEMFQVRVLWWENGLWGLRVSLEREQAHPCRIFCQHEMGPTRGDGIKTSLTCRGAIASLMRCL